jgi:hypothetical protein
VLQEISNSKKVFPSFKWFTKKKESGKKNVAEFASGLGGFNMRLATVSIDII